VAAGAKAELPFTVEKLDEAGDSGLTIAIRSLSPATLEREFILPKRTTLPLQTGQPQPLEIRWTGELAASGTLALVDDANDATGKTLELQLHVNDTDLHASQPHFFWEGSALELSLQQALTANAPIHSFLILPDKAADNAAAGTEIPLHFFRATEPADAPGLRGTLARNPGGYAATLCLGLGTLGLSPEKPILFDLALQISALGTAHGKVRATWQGSESIRTDSSRFGLLIPG
jgi:hypothetical protein